MRLIRRKKQPKGVYEFKRVGIKLERCSMWVVTTKENARTVVLQLAQWAQKHQYEAAFIYCAHDLVDIHEHVSFLRARWTQDKSIRERNGTWADQVYWYNANVEYALEDNDHLTN